LQNLKPGCNFLPMPSGASRPRIVRCSAIPLAASLFVGFLLLGAINCVSAKDAPPIGSHIPPGERPAFIDRAIWNSIFAGTTPSGRRLSAAELVPLVLWTNWPPPMPTYVNWHLEIGVFLLSVRPDGTVSNVEMLHTTGQRFLDRDVLKAFAKWRFRPGSVKEVRVPAHFTVHR
jgi:TonB family protein